MHQSINLFIDHTVWGPAQAGAHLPAPFMLHYTLLFLACYTLATQQMLNAVSYLGSLYTYLPFRMFFPHLLTWINSTHPLVVSMKVMSLGKLSLTPQRRFSAPVTCYCKTLYFSFMILISVVINYLFICLFNAYFS